MNIKDLKAQIEELGGIEAGVKTKVRAIVLGIVQMFLSKGEERNDVGVLNRFIELLSPANRRMVVAFFKANGPFSYDTERELFGKKIKKDKSLARRLELLQAFVDGGGDIWAHEDNASSTPKRSRKERLTSAVKSALNAKEDKLSESDVMAAVLEGGLSLDAVLAFLEQEEVIAVQEEKEDEAKAA